jgi:hypothetical protein
MSAYLQLTRNKVPGRPAHRRRGAGEGFVWAATHSACWAVQLSGRSRAATATQLMLVIALRRSGAASSPALGGTWTVLSGALQAVSVLDVIDDATRSALVGPVLESLASSRPPASRGQG